MIERLIRWGVPRYLGGPARSWVFTSLALAGYRLARGRTGKRELIDIGSVGKGQKIVIEQVSQTHTQQLKAEKQAKKAGKKAKKVAKGESKAAKKVVRNERRNERSLRRRAWVEGRRNKRAARAEQQVA